MQGFNEVLTQEPGEGVVAAVPLENGGKSKKGKPAQQNLVVEDKLEALIYTQKDMDIVCASKDAKAP